MAKVANFQDVFLMEISDMYNAEQQLTKALKKMASAASDPELQQAFEDHLEETQGQIETLDRVFEMCDMKPKKEKCEAMEGLIKEGEEAVDDIEEGPVRDVALIIAAQKVEHYEISGYGSLCALAKKMGLEEAANELYSILEEERATDEKLNTIAQDINEEAYEEGEDDEADEEEAA